MGIPRLLYDIEWKESETQRLTELAIAQGFRGIDTANQRRHYYEAAIDQTATETWMLGGDGADHLQGGAGSNLLLGGAGDDHLQAGRGRDVLIGGLGSDHLQAGQGEDILIAGTTDYDANDAALAAIMAEWGSANDYLARIANLLSSSFAYRLTGSTVHDDATDDHLQGGQGMDWFLAHLIGNKDEKDKLTPRKAR